MTEQATGEGFHLPPSPAFDGRKQAYSSWKHMIQRCTQPKCPAYVRYGGRGISVDPAWLSFEAFYRDMGAPPSAAHSLDRKEPNDNYCLNNCRWATKDIQNTNRRTTRWLEHNGERLPITHWAKRIGLSRASLERRILKHGVTTALSTPVDTTKQQVSKQTARILQPSF